ncbi:unnamed protein product [Staurois parvus]|uniref:Uncharacterized protein n=1 Tax=Staurois parvus TaxID=386267 RepID=A0ABN9DRB1_9NEOB|nr:unnamed protein product [Staurois parvus]
MGRMLLTLVVSGNNAPYIGGQWEECSLHWRSVEIMLLLWWSMGRMYLTLVVNGKNVPYIAS